MRRALTRIATLALLATSLAHADPAALAKAQALVDAGDFLAAEAAITNGISDSSDEAERAAFEFERIRIQRIRIDFPYDRKSIQDQLASDIPDVTREDMKRAFFHSVRSRSASAALRSVSPRCAAISSRGQLTCAGSLP